MNPEEERLQEAHDAQVTWHKWGPFLSERQWGKVREDYGQSGGAWSLSRLVQTPRVHHAL